MLLSCLLAALTLPERVGGSAILYRNDDTNVNRPQTIAMHEFRGQGVSNKQEMNVMAAQGDLAVENHV
jgi:hypothetical protein